MKPEIIRVPALNGLRWLQLSCKTLCRQPLIFVLVCAAQMVCLRFSQCLPAPLNNLPFVLVPFFSLAVILAAAQVSAGQRPGQAAQLTRGRGRLLPMLALGALYALSRLVLDALKVSPQDQTDIAWPALLPIYPLVAFGIKALCVLVWPAPALMHWHGVSLREALLLSTAAYMRNWRAFLLFGMATWLVSMALSGTATLAVKTSYPENALFIIALGAVPICMMVLMISNFFIFRDCFGARSPEPGNTDLRTA